MSLPSKNTKIQTSRMSPSASTTERGENARTAGAPPSASTTDGGPNARTAGAPLSASTTDRGESARTAGVPPSASTTSGAAGGTGGADEGTDAGKRKTREADKELLALLRETGLEKEVDLLAGHGVCCVQDVECLREEDLAKLGLRFRKLLDHVKSFQALVTRCLSEQDDRHGQGRSGVCNNPGHGQVSTT